MYCTADPCNSPLVYKGRENKEDYGCRNPYCRSRSIQYHPNVKVRDGWYYAAGYNLPFHYSDPKRQQPDYHYEWYALVGPSNNETLLQGLKLVERNSGRVYADRLSDPPFNPLWNERWECEQETLHSVPYYALPANGDFKSQFYIIRDRMMKEWLAMGSQQKHYKRHDYNPYYDVDDDFWDNYWYSSQRVYVSQATKIGSGIDIDDTTKKLIELAANNTNENEAKNAALKACERLRKILKP
jgi:hypothetical protein